MDPDANLAEQRTIVARMLDAEIVNPTDAERLAELVDGLDHWLSCGGFLPARWQEGRGKS